MQKEEKNNEYTIKIHKAKVGYVAEFFLKEIKDKANK